MITGRWVATAAMLGLSVTGCAGPLQESDVHKLRGLPARAAVVPANYEALATCVILALRAAPPDRLPWSFEYLGQKAERARIITAVDTPPAAPYDAFATPKPVLDVRFVDLPDNKARIEVRVVDRYKRLEASVRPAIDRCAWLEGNERRKP